VAKFDTVKMSYVPKLDKGQASIEMVVLFEDGDNIDTVVDELRNKIQSRIANLKVLSGQ